jgi:acetyl-CoA synthetase
MALPKIGEPSAVFPVGAAELAGPRPGELNITHACVDRHIAAGQGGSVALRWLGRGTRRRDFSYDELGEMADRMAAVLSRLGVAPGETVAVLLGRGPELYAGALGIWKVGAVFCPLFALLGPGPMKLRLELAKASVLIAGDGLYARTVADQRATLSGLRHVLLVGEDGKAARLSEGCTDLRALLAAADPVGVDTYPTRAGDAAILHFTSGTTGTPKPTVHAHGAVVAQLDTARQVFGITPDDVFWCTADPGWVTCTAYGMVAPLAAGCTVVVEDGEVEPRRWYSILRDEKVTAWYTTPTAIRTLMRSGAALARTFCRNTLRVVASVGEPLNPEAVLWGEKALGVPVRDTWWQTETGAITIANIPDAGRVRNPGSMGRPLPGVEAAVVRREGGGVVAVAVGVGELAIREGGPAMFIGYGDDEARRQACFADGWYLTGDLVRRDADGFYWFLGRADDMLNSGGHQIGPFEVECLLMDHPAVAEAGVVGRPDPLMLEVPVAFVTLNPGFEVGEALMAELLAFARHELGAAMAPCDVHFVAALPKTASGKILRRVLKTYAAGKCKDGQVVELRPGR